MIGSHEGTAHFLFSLIEIFFLFPLIFPAHSLSKQQENCLIIPWPWFFFVQQEVKSQSILLFV